MAVLPVFLLLAGCSDGGAPSGAGSGTGPLPMPSQTAQTSGAEDTMAESVIYRTEGITVTVTGMEEGLLGPEISFLAENDTEKNITISSRQLSVNGYMLETSALYTQVASGKKARDTLTVYQSELDRCGISRIGDLEFYLHILDSDTYAQIGVSELLTLRTSAYGSFTQEVNDGGQELLSDQGIRVVSQGLQEDPFRESSLGIFLENRSSRTVTVYAENVSVNGFMVDESIWTDLRPGTMAVENMLLPDTEADGEVREITFTLRVIDSRDWSDILEGTEVTLRFS